MARVRSNANKSTELRLMALFKAAGIRGWRRKSKMLGKPDFVFHASKTAVFVDGCFWHGCPIHGRMPKSNVAFWNNKIATNKKRDRTVDRTLTALGWTVVRIWEHELRATKAVQLWRRLSRLVISGTGYSNILSENLAATA